MFLLLLLINTYVWGKKKKNKTKPQLPVIALVASNKAWHVWQSYYLHVTGAKLY